jgi:3-deoxy-D-manno-octulosonic-acid transferase
MTLILKIYLYIFSIVLHPILYFILPLFVKKIRDRRNFELKNMRIVKSSQSWKVDNVIADFCFEISSEGELEQVLPIIQHFVKLGKRLELIFCSPSVEVKVLEMQKKYESSIRVFRLPLVSYTPWGNNISDWITSSNLVLCRYDFFPELIHLGLKRNFILIWASIKNKKNRLDDSLDSSRFNIFNKLYLYYYQYIFNSFDYIVAATKNDLNDISRLLVNDINKISHYEFRIERILERINNKQVRLKAKSCTKFLLPYIESFDFDKRVIFGSFWNHELDVLENIDFIERVKKSEILLMIAPHLLADKNVSDLKKKISFKFNSIPVYIVNLQNLEDYSFWSKVKKDPGIIIISIKGILVELYSSFHTSFIGGGNGKGVHSLLEPYISNNVILCGHNVHRSTEYDLINENEPDRILILNNLKEFFNKSYNIEENRLKTRLGAESLSDQREREKLDFKNLLEHRSKVLNNLLSFNK